MLPIAASTRALFAKEFRAAIPFFWLMVFSGAMSVLFYLGTSYPDVLPFASYFVPGADRSEVAVSLLLVAFFLALTLVVRERDSGTLDFLDGLPVGRTRIFAVKAATGILVLSISWVIDMALIAVTAWMSRSSVDPGIYFLPLVTVAALMVCQIYVFLGYGLLLANFRQFSFLFLGLAFAAWMGADARQLGWSSYLDITALSDLRYRGDSVVVPWDILGVQLLAGTVCYLVAWLVFLLQGDRSARLFAALKNRGIAATLFALLFVANTGVWIFVAATSEDGTEAPSSEASVPGVQGSADPETPFLAGAVFSSKADAITRTPDFIFKYPVHLSGRATGLISEADGIHRQVREFLGAEPAGSIYADLSSRSHFAAGLAFWKRVNLNLPAARDAAELRAVFAHELSHVYLYTLSGQNLTDPFFHEGAASYIEHRFFQGPEKLAALRRHAVASYARAKASGERLTLETLLDPGLLPALHDAYLVYPLGELFVEAIVHCYGEDSIGELAQSFSDLPDEPLSGTALWRDRFQSQGYDLSAVADRLFDHLETLATTTEAGYLDSLPTLRAELQINENDGSSWVVGIPSRPLPGGYSLRCQFRTGRAATIETYMEPEYTEPYEGNPAFYFDADLAIGGSLWYQLGIESPHTVHPVYTEWRQLPL